MMRAASVLKNASECHSGPRQGAEVDSAKNLLLTQIQANSRFLGRKTAPGMTNLHIFPHATRQYQAPLPGIARNLAAPRVRAEQPFRGRFEFIIAGLHPQSLPLKVLRQT